MIPLLYPSLPAAAQGLTNGTPLSDALSCEVVEQLNGRFAASLTYPIGGEHWQEIDIGNGLMIKPRNGSAAEPFEIDQIIRRPGSEITIYAHHAGENMANYLVSGFTARYAWEFPIALNREPGNPDLPQFAIGSPYKFSTDFGSTEFKPTYSTRMHPPKTLRDVIAGRDGFIDRLGGELEFTGYNVNILRRRGQDRGVSFLGGENLLNVTQTKTIRNFAIRGYPYYEKYTADGREYVELPEKVLNYEVAEYSDTDRTEPIDLSEWFRQKPTPAELKAAAADWINTHWLIAPKYEIRISVLPDHDSVISAGDTVSVRYDPLSINDKSRVIRTSYDSIREIYTSLDLGFVLPDFADTILSRR